MPNNSKQTRRFTESVAAQLENALTWLFLMILSSVARIVWLAVNWNVIDDGVTPAEWWRFFEMGFRYDSMTVTYLMLPFFCTGALIYFAPAWRRKISGPRRLYVTVLTFLITLLTFANASYFQFNNTVFDSYVFEFFNGNAQDAFNTAIQEHNAVARVTVAIVMSVCLVSAYRRFVPASINLTPGAVFVLQKQSGRILVATGIVICIVIGMRGRVGTRPLQRIDCGTTPYRVLNLGSLNPIYNLRTAWCEHTVQSDFYNENRIVPPETLSRQVATIATNVSYQKIVFSDLDGQPTDEFTLPVWQREASGPPAEKPEHVFVLFMESYDSWPFLDEYRNLHLVEEGKRLGDEGHRLMTYLPGANGSLLSSLVCLQGLFETNRMEQQCLPTSIVHAMNRLGYVTRSVNGFGSEWSNAQQIATEQGFNEIYCTAEIKPGGDTSNFQLHDRTLFDFTSERLPYDRPTFSFIRTSSYHGPFEVDLEAEDCVIEEIPEHLKRPGMRDEDQLCHAYGTLKYSDKVLGEFVRTMSARHPNSLFVITGDHYGRHFITTDPPVYEGSSVPLILYGPSVLKDTKIPETMAASHVDLATTLIELCAPQGFPYTSLGKNILQPAKSAFGVGKDFVIFPNSIVCLRGRGECTPLPWQSGELTKEAKQAAIARAREIHEAYYGVGYMMSRKALEFY